MTRAFSPRTFNPRSWSSRALAGPAGGVVTVSTHYRLLVAVGEDIKTTLIGAGLMPGHSASRVIVRKVPYVSDIGTPKSGSTKTYALPAIVVCPGVNEQFLFGTNERDDIGYPVNVLLLDADSSPDNMTDQHLGWRERITERYIHPKHYFVAPSPAGDIVFHDCNIEPGPIVDYPRWIGMEMFVSLIGLRFFTRHSRNN